MATALASGPLGALDLGTWDRARAGDVIWRVQPGWTAELLGPEGLPLARWRSEGRVSTIKSGPHRVVYRVELPSGAVYVKHFLVPNVRAIGRQWLRRGKGRNEAKQAEVLRRAGVPTIEPIALGEQRKYGFLFENYLVTREVPDMRPLDDYLERIAPGLPPRTRARVRHEIALALADLTARLHHAGLVHQDFHPGNVLVDGPGVSGEDAPVTLAMIDLDALRRQKVVGWRDVVANIAKLDHYFWLRSGRSERLRFARAYLETRTRLAGRAFADVDSDWIGLAVQRETRAWAERLWKRWGKRCHGANKYFQVVKLRRGWAIATSDLDPAAIAQLLRDPDAPFRDPASRILKDGRTTKVASLALPLGIDGRAHEVVYKKFHVKKRLDPILALFRPSRAWAAWQAAQHFVSRGLPTPRNLAILTRTGWLGLPRAQYLIVERAEPSITLDAFVRDVLPTFSDGDRRRQIHVLTRSLARLMRTMHERSMTNRDLKASNLLLVGDPAEGRLTLIDLVGTRLAHPLPRDRRVQNLARLQVSLAEAPGRTLGDGLRFLRAYLPWGLSNRDEWRRLWRDVEDRCRGKIAQNRRRGRRLS